jgi:hypothetical protein
MRVEFIELKKRTSVNRIAPWACMIVKVEGGWMAFESIEDYRTWNNQK